MLQDGGVRGEFGSGFGKRGRGQRKEFSIPVSQPFCVPAPGPGPGRQCEGAAVPEDDAYPPVEVPEVGDPRTPARRHCRPSVCRHAIHLPWTRRGEGSTSPLGNILPLTSCVTPSLPHPITRSWQ